MKHGVVVFIILISSICANAKGNSSASQIKNKCIEAFKENMKDKTNSFCICYTYNILHLISPVQTTPILKWLNNEMSEAEQLKQEPLIDMEYEITKQCASDKKWVAEKILNMKKKRSKTK